MKPSETVSHLAFAAVVLVVGVGGALGSVALGETEMAMSIMGFAGGVLSGQAWGRMSKPKQEA